MEVSVDLAGGEATVSGDNLDHEEIRASVAELGHGVA